MKETIDCELRVREVTVAKAIGIGNQDFETIQKKAISISTKQNSYRSGGKAETA